MLKIRGISQAAGIAFGSVLILRNGVTVAHPPAFARGNHAQNELQDVVLIADDLARAANAYIPWVNVVGIAAEHVAGEFTGLAVPTLLAASDTFASVQNGDLALLDGDHGLLVINPDSHTIAAYQAQRERLLPRTRIHLGQQHDAATSLDGKPVRVMALASTIAQVREALDNGADALYIPEGSPLLPADIDDDDQYKRLSILIEAAAGKPLTIAGDAESISLAAIARANLRAELTLCVPLAQGPEWLMDLRSELSAISDELLDEGEPFSDIRLSGATTPHQGIEAPLEALGLNRLVVLAQHPTDTQWDALGDIAQEASELLVPVEVVCGPRDIENALRHGASGLIVEAESVLWVKDRIRELDIGQLRSR